MKQQSRERVLQLASSSKGYLAVHDFRGAHPRVWQFIVRPESLNKLVCLGATRKGHWLRAASSLPLDLSIGTGYTVSLETIPLRDILTGPTFVQCYTTQLPYIALNFSLKESSVPTLFPAAIPNYWS